MAIAIIAGAVAVLVFRVTHPHRPVDSSVGAGLKPAPESGFTATPRAGFKPAPTVAVAFPPTAPVSTAIAPVRPTPAAFDLGTLTPPARAAAQPEDERFRTTDQFTADDQRHPERYFERAEQVPELNRPEERRDALAYFLAYRDRLANERQTLAPGDERQAEIDATIARYDAAIARMRALLATPVGTP
jgi:hypothetical protein